MDGQQETSSLKEGSTLTDPEVLLVICAGRLFTVNRRLICDSSLYIKNEVAKFRTREEYLILPDLIHPDFFSLFLSAIQSPLGIAPMLTPENVYHVLFFAQLLQMTDIVLQCKEFFSSSPSSSLLLSHLDLYWKLQYWPHMAPPLASNDCGFVPNFCRGPTAVKRPPVVVLSKESSEEDAEEIDVVNEEEEEEENSGYCNNMVAQVVGQMEKLEEKPTAFVRFDIAACDGPVQFRRILNSCLTSEDENGLEVTAATSATQLQNDASRTFRCYFCNHVFKSRYCFQKHKKRHLNPTTVDATSSSDTTTAKKAGSREKEDLVLKDINVQFFPCKICGEKFPSYYFVHKHKKLWHSDSADSEIASQHSSLEEAASLKERPPQDIHVE